MVNDTHTRRRRSKKSSDFHEILYTAADFELDERHVIKNEKVALDRLEFDRTYFLLRKRNYIFQMLTTTRLLRQHKPPPTSKSQPEVIRDSNMDFWINSDLDSSRSLTKCCGRHQSFRQVS